jgi:hypothetical protein
MVRPSRGPALFICLIVVASMAACAGSRTQGNSGFFPQSSPNDSARFLTSSLPRSNPANGRTIRVRRDATTLGPNTTSVTMYQAPLVQNGMRYNLQIDYSDGSSVIGDMIDSNDIILEHPNGTWSAWSVQFSLGTDGNVYLTMVKLSGSQTGPTSTPAGLTSTMPLATPVAKPTGSQCKPRCFAERRNDSTACVAASGAAGVLGAVIFAAATADATIGVLGAVGTLLGPEGTAAGVIFGAWAVAQTGASTFGSLVGGAVFSTVATAICETFTPDSASPNGPISLPKPILNPWPNPTGAGGGVGGYGTYPTTGQTWVISGFNTSVSCCYPTPIPTPGGSSKVPL